MPSASSVHRTLAKKKRCGPTHREVMEKRHAKRRKNEKKNLKTKKMSALKEYQRLSKVEYVSKKTTAMNLMELVEDIKESIPEGTYLKMMDELMALNKETEEHQHETQTPADIRRSRDNLFRSGEYIINYFMDRIGDQHNIARDDNANYEINHNTTNIISEINTNIINVEEEEGGNWYRTADGTWRERNPRTHYGIGARA
jgi:anti-sigma28 factor (negative regulator of flagellin synthesis)